MPDEKLHLWFAGAAILFFTLVIAIRPIACTVEPERATSVLEAEGYQDIELKGYNWFACSNDDWYSTGFSAHRENVRVVNGTVCCGLMKDCTIRH